MKKLFLLSASLLLLCGRASADEGMWLLQLLAKQNIEQMQAQGLRLSAEDIYNADGTSLKDAIVIFGNGCTGEIVSADGLLFTNHHCGYSNIQSLSSVENDYLADGFWAMDRTEELPAPGLSVRFIRKIEDVTATVLNGVSIDMPQADRDAVVAANVAELTAEKMAENPGMEVSIQDFFGENQYIMFFIERYNDVRLVGTPPSSIGKFGGDTDNWMWPRHTGDFSVFRVYADENGRPAEYSKDNVPYKADAHLKISLRGYQEGDFAMIMGFPGSTDRYMTSYEIDQVLDYDNPTRIYIRGIRQDILREFMYNDDAIRIQYANKYANSSNYWKNSIGMSRGLRNLNVRAKKEAQQAEFTRWISESGDRAHYSRALPLIEEAISEGIPYDQVSQYLVETALIGTELIMASTLQMHLNDETEAEFIDQVLLPSAAEFYKDYNATVDRAVAKAMLRILFDSLPAEIVTVDVRERFFGPYNGDIDAYVDYLYDNSSFTSYERFEQAARGGDYGPLANDPAVKLREWVYQTYEENRAPMMEAHNKFREGHRLYVAGLLEMESGQSHYPDANFTIRLTYGNILPYSPADGVIYNYYTTLSGVIAKEDPSNPEEFEVPERLKELYYAKDFGQYAYRGDVPVGFLSNNDITGGNSGSPVLNADGELIGLAFDGNWEAMSGDIAFEPNLQRTINVDVRYVLFVIDKFAGAGYLLDEMTIVR